jgi:hypothetical protein
MNPCFTFNKLRRVIIVFPISAFFNYVFVAPYMKRVFISLIFCPKFILLVIRQLKKDAKITSYIGEINKIAIINNPFTKLASLNVPYVNKLIKIL